MVQLIMWALVTSLSTCSGKQLLHIYEALNDLFQDRNGERPCVLMSRQDVPSVLRIALSAFRQSTLAYRLLHVGSHPLEPAEHSFLA
jgi:hypothetical protein